MSRVFLSLGSNMGDRSANISQAVSLLSISDKIKLLKHLLFMKPNHGATVNKIGL